MWSEDSAHSRNSTGESQRWFWGWIWLLMAAVFLGSSCIPAPIQPTSTPLPTLTARATPSSAVDPPVLSLETVDPRLHVFPGPEHYTGELLTFEIDVGERVPSTESPVTLQLDDQPTYQVTGMWEWHFLRFPFDTTGLVGKHELSIQAAHHGVEVDELYRFEVHPASQRPEQEQDPAWTSREIDCCILHFITGTAASRDLDQIARAAQQGADDFQRYPTVNIDEKIDVYFIDRMWFNGAFAAGDDLLISYTDRYYGPSRGEEGLQVLVRHELGHAVFPSFTYGEGLSVYLAGGHYKFEPLPRRAAAMLALDYYSAEDGPDDQHEIIYLHQAAVVQYMVETYGWAALREFIDLDRRGRNERGGNSSEAFQQALGISRDAFQDDFMDWLRSLEPGQQVQDLELTVELQNLRRAYQERYAPFPWFLLGPADEFTGPDLIHVNIREPRTPAHMAAELMIANAQQALYEGEYHKAQELIHVINGIVSSGHLDAPLAREYGDVVRILDRQGYEVLALDLNGREARVEVSAAPPDVETLLLQKEDGRWRITDPRD